MYWLEVIYFKILGFIKLTSYFCSSRYHKTQWLPTANIKINFQHASLIPYCSLFPTKNLEWSFNVYSNSHDFLFKTLRLLNTECEIKTIFSGSTRQGIILFFSLSELVSFCACTLLLNKFFNISLIWSENRECRICSHMTWKQNEKHKLL